ncbi:metallopeptidase family protein [Dermacoccus nishinomiyaensis]
MTPRPTPRAPRGDAPTRRDRHGRRHRGPLAWPPTPSMLSRARLFDEAVLRSVERLEARWGESLEHIEIGVEEVPPSDPSAWEDAVPLGRAFPAEGKHRARMVIYRLPIQTRSADLYERDLLVEHVVTTQIAALLGRELDEDDQ